MTRDVRRVTLIIDKQDNHDDADTAELLMDIMDANGIGYRSIEVEDASLYQAAWNDKVQGVRCTLNDKQ